MDPYATSGGVYQQQNQSAPGDGEAWWFKWLIKSAAVILGFIAFILGLLTAINFSPLCIISGLILCASAVIVLALEVPICFSFVEFLRPVTAFSEGRPHWQKVIIYMIPPMVVIALCHDVAPILGSLCIFGVAALYFMLTIGKKASFDEMRNRATVTSESRNDLTNEQIP